MVVVPGEAQVPQRRVALVFLAQVPPSATPMSLSLDERNPRMWRYAPRTGVPPPLHCFHALLNTPELLSAVD